MLWRNKMLKRTVKVYMGAQKHMGIASKLEPTNGDGHSDNLDRTFPNGKCYKIEIAFV